MRDFILRHKKKSPYVHLKRWREQSRKKPNDNASCKPKDSKQNKKEPWS